MEEATDLSGYVVRQEQVLRTRPAAFCACSGPRGNGSAPGGTVALVYADQASLDRQQEMEDLGSRIEQLQFAQEAALGSEISLKLDAQITRSLLAYRADLAADRLDKAEEHETDLRSLVLKRDYTNTDTEDLSGQITELKSQLKSLQAQAASSIRRVSAPVSGIYSAVVDGYEAVLTPAALAELTPSRLSALQADGRASSQVGKLILGDTWYYAVAMDAAAARELEKGGAMTLRFAKGVEQDLTVSVASVGPEENGRAVVSFQSSSNLPQLTLLRHAERAAHSKNDLRHPGAQGGARAANTKMDETGRRTVEEGLGVYCIVGMEARFKPVEVVYNGDGFVLVRSTANTDQEKLRLRPGDEVILAANDLYDGKVVG